MTDQNTTTVATADVTKPSNIATVTSVGNTAEMTSVGGFIATNTASDSDFNATNTVTNTTPDTMPNVTILSNTDLDKVLNAWSADINKVKHTDGYTPVFNNTVRTIIYIIALIASVAGLGLMSFGHADIGGFISTAAGIIAGGFGVAYNPLRQN